MKKFLLYLCLAFMASLSLLAQERRSIIIQGKIHRPKDTLVVLKSGEDFRYNGIEIPVREDSTFSYQLEIDETEKYELIFNSELKDGAWMPVHFFSDGDTITFELFSIEEYKQNKINGSQLTKELKKLYAQRIAIFSKELNYWYKQLNESKQDSIVKNRAKAKIDSIHYIIVKWQHEYFSKDPSLLGFYEFIDNLKNADELPLSEEEWYFYYNYWVKLFPSHPLAKRAKNLLSAMSKIKVGGNFVDFPIKVKDNETITFSQLLKKNNYTLLDLWAPWCGPCIKKSKAIKENFKTLEAAGLGVVAVLGGIKNNAEFDKTAKRYGYPWSVYPEINDENALWEKYGIANSGGSQFLMDKSGKILAINPNVEEIRTIMNR